MSRKRKTAPLAGNSIATDRGFLARDMPALDAYLHYRMIDVSSIKELCRRWYPRVYYGQPEKGLAHRALADIHESIRELQLLPPQRLRAAARGRRPARSRRSPPRLDGAPPRSGDTDSARRPRAANLAFAALRSAAMVGVAQLVEHLVVVQEVAGSSPVTHPNEGIRSPNRRWAFSDATLRRT